MNSHEVLASVAFCFTCRYISFSVTFNCFDSVESNRIVVRSSVIELIVIEITKMTKTDGDNDKDREC